MNDRAKKSNIVLIGMPGAGKSSVGVVLAKALHLNFLDVDLVIQGLTDKTLSELLDDRGVEEFLKLEGDICGGIDVKRHVIATGGSAIYDSDGMKHLHDIGVVVHLDLLYEELERRLGSLVERGVAMKQGQTLQDLYAERNPLYQSWCDIRLDVSGQDIHQTVGHLREALSAFGWERT